MRCWRHHIGTKWELLQRQSVLNFCYSKNSLSIDSNSRKIATINDKMHVGRVRLVQKINE